MWLRRVGIPTLRHNRKTANLRSATAGCGVPTAPRPKMCEPSTESSCGVGATDDDNSTRAVGMRLSRSDQVARGEAELAKQVARGRAAPIRSKLCVCRRHLRSNPRSNMRSNFSPILEQLRQRPVSLVECHRNGNAELAERLDLTEGRQLRIDPSEILVEQLPT